MKNLSLCLGVGNECINILNLQTNDDVGVYDVAGVPMGAPAREMHIEKVSHDGHMNLSDVFGKFHGAKVLVMIGRGDDLPINSLFQMPCTIHVT